MSYPSYALPAFFADLHAPPPAEHFVCCHCKRPAVEHLFCCDGHWISAWSCPIHGDVVPIRSAVVNRAPAAPDWSMA